LLTDKADRAQMEIACLRKFIALNSVHMEAGLFPTGQTVPEVLRDGSK
jgi:hypothetical protein